MIDYVLGFAFSTSDGGTTMVTLIEKKKPEWQAGKLNGVGGKVEGPETFQSAMAREFEEETGVQTSPASWVEFATMLFPDARIVCFATTLLPGYHPHTTTEERVSLERAYSLPSHCIPNLRWLIPMALNRLSGKEESSVFIEPK